MLYNSITNKWKDMLPVNNRLIETSMSYGIELGYFPSVILRLLIVITLLGLLPVLASATTLKVDAGPAGRVIYPSSNSATLSGKESVVNGTANYEWKQVSGNSLATIVYANEITTQITNLKPGIYSFTLTITDSTGTSQADTTTISVLRKITWTVEGIEREALVHLPAIDSLSTIPVIFAFHGHGGTDSGFAQKGFELSWPEAIVVYPQGLHSWSRGDVQAKQSGWQHAIGEVSIRTGIKDQDLKFFDTMLAAFKQRYHIDSSKIFVHGWSNGSEFIYDVLWAARGNELAALAPAAGTLAVINGKNPLPVIHVAGTADTKVRFSRQQKSVQSVLSLDECSSSGTTWATGASGLLATYYDSPINAPVVSLQYDGDHAYPYTVPALIVKFFKEVKQPENKSLSMKN